ncbi:MAG: ABC transporter ATP-binding protein [Clostridiales bacterium]|nr:ABC transporter ATP-binding protein [Clostridiales bacterium]
MNKYNKRVLNDCVKAVSPSAVFNISDAVIGSLLAVYTSSILAKFADAIFEQDITYGMRNFSTLILCILISLFVLPLFGTLKEIFLFNSALQHNRMIYSRYLNKKFEDAQQFTQGEVEYRLEQDAIDMRCMWLDLLTNIIATPIMLMYLLYHSIRISLIYTVIIFVVSAIKLLIPIITKKLNTKYDKEVRAYQTQVRSYEFEILEQPHKVKLYGLTMPLLERFDRIYLKYFGDTLRKSIRLNAISSNLSGALDTLCTIIILLSGAVLVANNKMTAGGIAAAFGFLSIFNSFFGNISALIRDFPIFGTLVERLSIFYTDEEDSSGAAVSTPNKIQVKSLSFAYGEKTVIDNLTFTVNKGDKVAICGPNGSGKSTLIKVLCGLLKNYSGSIKINGQELSTLSPFGWYDSIAYTEQDPYLFQMGIRDNIHIGNLNASKDEVDSVIQKLEIEYLIERYPLGEKIQLSGGEKQKVSIARALLKNTPIIIMDEPTNNLDNESCEWLQQFIKNSNKTIIFVSHDSSLISCADRIVTL